jgi:26S proteasome regulatory subunit N1
LDATIETLKAIEHSILKQAQILAEAYLFAGTGNMLRVHAMLHHCDEHVQSDKNKEEKEDELKVDDTFLGRRCH